MAQITGGLVSIEDGTKKQEEYAPPRKVRVDLTFTVGEGEDYSTTFDRASEAASNRVASLLGQKPSVVQTLAPATEANEATSPPAPRRTRRTNAQIEADNAAKAAGASQTGNAGGEQTSDDPASLDLGDGGGAIQLPDQTGGDDPAAIGGGDEDWSAPPAQEDAKPVTDADLNSAVQKKNAEIANPDAIRALIGAYNPDPTQPFQLRQIPAESRGEFLTKLAALTKAA